LVRNLEPLLNPDEKALFATVQAARTPYVESYQHALSLLITEHKRDEARKMMTEVVRPKLIAYHLAWTVFDQHESDEIDQVINKANEEYVAGRRDFLLTLLVADLIAGAIAIFTVAHLHWQISVRLRAEEELKQHRQHLEELVVARTAALKESNEKLSVEISERKQIDESLRQSEERTRFMLEGIKEYAFLMLDVDGRVLSWNSGAERLKGYRAEEIVGQHLSRFYPEDKIREGFPERELQEAAEKGRFENEGWRVRKDGSRFLADVIISAVRNPQGELIGFVKLVRDLTARQRAEQALLKSQQMFEGLFENSPDAVILVNHAGCIVRVNAQIAALFGYTREELEGQSVDTLMPERYRARHGGGLAGYFAAPCTRAMGAGLELFAGRKDGSEFPVDIMLSPLKTDEGNHALAVIRDITSRKEATERIQQLNEKLKRRAAELTAANKELEAFSYSVSHDLRAPLRHVHGYVDMLAKATEGQLVPKARHYMQSITEASEDMGQLIDDLLSFSRLGRTEKQETIIDLDKMMQDTRQGLEMETKGRNIVWKIAPLPHVLGDPAMLRQVLANLIGNAVKYSRGRDPAEIEIGCAGEENGRRIFFVRDNGVGFDMQYADKLFGVFQRLHSHEEFEGTGIGLATVRRILTRHGDRVWAESEINKGATFFFTLKPATTV
jgi:PAS domain S-box-containing protein